MWWRKKPKLSKKNDHRASESTSTSTSSSTQELEEDFVVVDPPRPWWQQLKMPTTPPYSRQMPSLFFPSLNSTSQFSDSSQFGLLSEELCILVLSWLELRDLLNVARLNHYFYRLCNDNALWKAHYYAIWGPQGKMGRPISYPPNSFPGNSFVQNFQPGFAGWKPFLYYRCYLDYAWLNEKPRISILEGHNDGVRCVQFDDRIIASGGGPDKQLKLWDPQTKKCVKTLSNSEQCLQSLIFHPHILPNIIITGGGSTDRTIVYWDVEAAETKRTLTGHGGWIPTLRFNNQILVSGSEDGSIRIWDLETGQPIKVFENCHKDTVWKLDFDENKIISVSHDMYTHVWDIRSGENTMSYRSSKDTGVYCVKFDDKKIVVGSKYTVDMYDVRSSKLLHAFTDVDDWVMGVDFDGRKLVAGGYGNNYRVQVWDLATFSRERELSSCHTDAIRAIQMTERFLVTCSLDKNVHYWDFDPDTEN